MLVPSILRLKVGIPVVVEISHQNSNDWIRTVVLWYWNRPVCQLQNFYQSFSIGKCLIRSNSSHARFNNA